MLVVSRKFEQVQGQAGSKRRGASADPPVPRRSKAVLIDEKQRVLLEEVYDDGVRVEERVRVIVEDPTSGTTFSATVGAQDTVTFNQVTVTIVKLTWNTTRIGLDGPHQFRREEAEDEPNE